MKTGRALMFGIVLSCAALGSMLSAPPTDGCGPEFPAPIFTGERDPDRPLERYAAGELGIVVPTFYQRYLVIAYRHLRGLGLDAAGGRAALGLPDSTRPGRGGSESAYWEWAELRRKYPGADSAVGFRTGKSLPRQGNDYFYADYDNCLEDALRTAMATLADREQRAGAESPWFQDWLRAQDRVFANCSAAALVPEPAPEGAPPWLRADRDYQTAAAHFYGGRFDEAASAFERIARDPVSPWRTLAPYLVARCYARKGTLLPTWRTVDREALAQADAQIRRVLGDMRLSETHEAARRLLGFVRFRLAPEERLRELCRSLTAPRPGPGLRQDVVDFTLLLDRYRQSQAESLFAVSPDYELMDWVLTLQSGSPRATRHALDRWTATRSPAWLVAALSHLRADAPALDATLEASAEVKASSPAFATVSAHRVRLLIERGRHDQARALLDHLLPQARRSWPRSALNVLLGQRLRLARSVDEFVAFAPRRPSEVVNLWGPISTAADSGRPEVERAFAGPDYLDADAAWTLNRRLPLSVLGRIARAKALPRNLRAQVALSAWTRAVALGRLDAALELAPVLSDLLPETRSYLERFVAAKNDSARRFEATVLMLNVPGVNPSVASGTGRLPPLGKLDEFRDNWWCAAEASDFSRGVFARDVFARWPYGERPLGAPDTLWEETALTDEERTAARSEAARLESLPAAPSLLCRETVAWAKSHPADPRLPQTLHLAVRSSRYGCPDAHTSEFSKQAFQILHRRFPKSEWAQKTKYYY